MNRMSNIQIDAAGTARLETLQLILKMNSRAAVIRYLVDAEIHRYAMRLKSEEAKASKEPIALPK